MAYHLRFTQLIGLFLIVIMSACGNSNEYHKTVERELGTGVRHDSIFLGFYLGMPQKDFFDRCWKMNKEGLMQQGVDNSSVNIKMDILDKKVDVDFYPSFYKGKAYEMAVIYRYLAWSPWMKDLWSEPLMYRILAIYEKAYGEGFLEVKHPKLGSAFVKIDGNRRISIYQKDDQRVRVIFTDLLVEEAAEKNLPKLAEGKGIQPAWWKK